MKAQAPMKTSMSSVSVIIPAAGCGARANLGGNKILAPLCGRTVLEWTLDAFSQPNAMPENCALTEIIVAARPDEWPLIEAIFKAAKSTASTCSALCSPGFRLAHGGATRQDSVSAALAIARGDWIAIHDAARPLASPALIARVIAAALDCGGAIAALPVADTVKWSAASGDMIDKTLERARVHLAQTPQVFARTLFQSALSQATRDNFQGTDCASLVERARDENGEPQRVALVAGEANNFKITFAEDLARATQILDEIHQGKSWREQRKQ